MEFLKLYLREEIITGIVLVIFLVLRAMNARIVRRYAKVGEIIEHRASLVIKYINFIILVFALIIILAVWGVRPQNLFITFSSIFTVIGVAMFAQWSMLSNVTAGIILFFASPFKIGDTISIFDKEFPIIAEIEDIKGIYTYLKTKEGEKIVYPNSLLLQKGISIIQTYESEKEFTD